MPAGGFPSVAGGAGVVAMQTTWSRPVVEVVVFSNEGLRKVVNAMLYISTPG